MHFSSESASGCTPAHFPASAREAGGFPELRIEVIELPPLELRLLAENPLLRVGKDAIQASQYRQRQDDILIFAALEGIPDEICNAPEPTDDFTVILANARSKSVVPP
jgi:hypothetical protein